MSKPKRLLLIGDDGAIPEMVLRFRKDLPHIDALMRRGSFAPACPSPPTDTPTNWTTIATGAWTRTHGINGFFVHLPGEPYGQVHHTLNSRLCQAEYLWQAAERAGKRSLLINYPVAWPPTVEQGVVIGGDGVLSEQWRLLGEACYVTDACGMRETTLIQLGPLSLRSKGRGAACLLPRARAEASSAPTSRLPVLEAWIPLQNQVEGVWSAKGWQPISEPDGWGGETTDGWRLLVLSSRASGYDRVVVENELGRAELDVGEWSPWMKVEMQQGQGTTRFKLLSLSEDGTAVAICRTPVNAASAWSFPPGLEAEVVREVGPYHEGLETRGGLGVQYGWFGWDTGFEFVRMQIDWLARATRYLLASQGGDLIWVQMHLQDMLNHMLLSYVDEGHPAYDPEEAAKYSEILRQAYRLTDEFVGRIVEACADEETLVAFVSDHGSLPLRRRFFPLPPLIREGLLVIERGETAGRYCVNHRKSRVLPLADYDFWINLKGRDPDGIVEPGEYEQVRERAIAALRGMRDPLTGECPYSAVLRREEAEMLGYGGERTGDIVTFWRPGYVKEAPGASFDDWNHLDAGREAQKGLDFLMFGDFAEARGGTHCYLPDAQLAGFSNRAVMLLAGPGVRQGHQVRARVDLVDLAPTLAHLLGIPQPKDADGKIIGELLDP